MCRVDTWAATIVTYLYIPIIFPCQQCTQMVLQTVFIWELLENFRKNRFLTQKPALFFSPSTWNTIGHYCKPPPGMGDQKVRKGPSPSILRTTIGKSWHCQNWRSTTPRIPEFWHKGGFGDKKSVTCDN